MKILWFANTPCGATEKLTGASIKGGGWLYALSDGLKRVEGVELHIAFYWGIEISPFEYEGIHYNPVLRGGDGTKLGRYINRIKDQFSDSSDKIEVSRCLSVVKAVNPDIIHIHGSEENFGLIAKSIENQKIVMSIQGMLNPLYSKYFSGYPRWDVSNSESVVKKIMMDGIAASVRSLKRKKAREICIYQNIEHIIGRTWWDKACSLALNPNRKYYEVNEIIRSDFFEAKWSKVSEVHPFTLVTTVSSGLYKGVESVFLAADIMSRAGFKFTWKVIGMSPHDSIISLNEKIHKVDTNRLPVELLGRMGASDMIDVMLKSDVFVQVSHIENSPNSLCEAMLLGMPIIATFAGGTSSMIKDKEEGFLVQDGDPFAMAGIIMQSAIDYNQAVDMGTKARLRAHDRHNMKNVVKELLDVYNVI